MYEIDLGPDRGVVELRFVPEVLGTVFIDAQEDLADEQNAFLKLEDRREQAVAADDAVRRFITTFMNPESAPELATFDESGAVVTRLDLPGWVIHDLTQWVIETYGRRPTGSSNASAPPSPPAGRPSTAVSPSKASTRRRGR